MSLLWAQFSLLRLSLLKGSPALLLRCFRVRKGDSSLQTQRHQGPKRTTAHKRGPCELAVKVAFCASQADEIPVKSKDVGKAFAQLRSPAACVLQGLVKSAWAGLGSMAGSNGHTPPCKKGLVPLQCRRMQVRSHLL